jgi:[ribosomal protein S5]-alanine N-acetyltransferase
MPCFDSLQLRSERLLLRPLRDGDAAALLAIFSDPRVMRYWSTPPWAGTPQAHVFIERSRDAMHSGEALRLGLERMGDARLIGQCTLFDFVGPSRRAEIGYSMAADAWGKGLMGEALRALLDYGFGELQLNRIEADIDPRNTASARSLERLGFTREGLLRERWIVAGEVSDTALYGLLAREWRDPLDDALRGP